MHLQHTPATNSLPFECNPGPSARDHAYVQALMFDFDDLERVLSEDEARPDAWAYLLDGRDRKRSADCFLSGHGAARGFEVEAHELCIYSAACLSIHECLCVCVRVPGKEPTLEHGRYCNHLGLGPSAASFSIRLGLQGRRPDLEVS